MSRRVRVCARAFPDALPVPPVASHKDLLARVALRVGSKDKEAPADEPQPPGFSRSSPEDRQARAA